MLEKSQRDLRRSVRRMLAARIAMVTLPLAVAAGMVAFVMERDRLGEDVISWTVMQASLFNAVEGQALDRVGEIEGADLEAALRSFADRQGGGRFGRFDAVRVFLGNGESFADVVLQDSLPADQLADLLDERRYPALEGAWCRVVRSGGEPLLILQMPLATASASRIFMRGVFRPTPGVVAATRTRAIRVALAVTLMMCVVGVALWPLIGGLVGRLGRLSGNLLEANLGTLDALGRALAKRDGDTEEHSLRVTILSVRLAEEIGLDGGEIQDLIKGASLHDVGKIAIRDEILLKRGRLTDEEREVMKSHVEHGLDIVSRASWLQPASDVVHYHHERFGGGGYADGLEGSAIPLAARIFAIVDVFDALSSPRPYKEAMGFKRSMTIMRDGRGGHFDPELFDAFEGIAAEVYERYYGTDAEHLGEELDRLVDRYFSGGLDALEVS